MNRVHVDAEGRSIDIIMKSKPLRLVAVYVRNDKTEHIVFPSAGAVSGGSGAPSINGGPVCHLKP